MQSLFEASGFVNIEGKNQSMATDEIKQLVVDKANQYGIAPGLALAQIQTESSFNPRAVSPAGAKGLAQFMPATAARFGLTNPFDPVASMDAWGQYMILMLSMFNGRYDLTLAGYISGENRAEYANAAREGRAINWSVLPAKVRTEARPYVEGIMSQAGISYDFSGQSSNLGPIVVVPGGLEQVPDWLKWAGLGLIAFVVWSALSD